MFPTEILNSAFKFYVYIGIAIGVNNINNLITLLLNLLLYKKSQDPCPPIEMKFRGCYEGCKILKITNYKIENF